MTVYHPTHVAIPYNAGGLTHKRLADVYYPLTPAPQGGYPTLFYMNAVGFTLSSRSGVASADDGHDLLRYYALEAGWALVDVELTMQDVGGTPVGGGLYRDPTTDATYSLDGTGHEVYNSDARNVIQKFRSEAAAYGLNPYLFAAAGNSAGALCAMAAAYELDGADLTNPLAMRRASTRVQALVDLKISGWLPGVVQDSAVGGALDTGNPILCKASNPAQLAVDGDDALPEHALHLSPHWIMLQPGSVALNRRLPVYCWVNTPPEGQTGKEPIEPPALNYNLDADLMPAYEGTSTGGIVDRHAGFGGIMRMKALRALDSWHVTHSKLVGTASFTVGGVSPDAVISDQHLAAQDQAAWLNTVVPLQVPSGPMSTGSRTVGAQYLDCTSLGAVYALDGHGGTTDVIADCIIDPLANVVIEQVNLESVAGEDPCVTLVDAAGNPFLEVHFAAQSTGRATAILSAQHGVTDYGAAADVATATITAVGTLAKARPRLNNIRRSDAGKSTPDAVTSLVNRDLGQLLSLTDPTTLRFDRLASGENSDHKVAWSVLEHLAGTGSPDEVVIRHNASLTIPDASASASTAAISAIVDVTRCVAWIEGTENDRNAGGWDTVGANPIINPDKTVTVTRSATSGPLVVRLIVEEYVGTNWTVATFSKVLTSPGGVRQPATLSVAIPSFAHAFIVGHFRPASGETSVDESGCLFMPPASGTTTIDIGISSGADTLGGGGYLATGFVVYNAGITVHHDNGFDGGLALMGSGAQTQDFTMPEVDIDQSFLICSGASTGAGTTYPQPNCNYRYKDGTGEVIEVWRSRSGSTLQLAIQSIDMSALGLEFPPTAAVAVHKFGADGAQGLQGPFGVFVSAEGMAVKVFYRLLG